MSRFDLLLQRLFDDSVLRLGGSLRESREKTGRDVSQIRRRVVSVLTSQLTTYLVSNDSELTPMVVANECNSMTTFGSIRTEKLPELKSLLRAPTYNTKSAASTSFRTGSRLFAPA